MVRQLGKISNVPLLSTVCLQILIFRDPAAIVSRELNFLQRMTEAKPWGGLFSMAQRMCCHGLEVKPIACNKGVFFEYLR